MLSDSLIKHLGIRTKLMKYLGCTVFSWDSEKSEVIPAPKYLYWNWMMFLLGGCNLSLTLSFQIYLKVSNSEEELASQNAFATLMFTWGEMITNSVICILAFRINNKEAEIRYLMNQMFKYHREQIMPWLNERKILLDADHKRSIRVGEVITLGAAYGSYLFPFIMMAAFFHPLEPIHNVFLEWLEWDINLNTITWSHAVYGVVLVVAVSAAANTIITFTNLIICYFLIATLSLGDMLPTEVALVKSSKQVTFQTNFYGELSDEDIIKMFRVQELYLKLVNNVVASAGIASHHVALLASSCIMAFFAIKYSSVLAETGVVGYIIVGAFFGVPVFIEYLEASMFGTLVQLSEDFKDNCDKLVGRRKLMKVFSRSCVTFYVKQAYPFFNITMDHSVGFMSEVVDKTITLLLW